MTTISTELKRYKKDRGYTYDQMVEISGVIKSRIERYCRGVGDVNYNDLVKICNRCFDVHSTDITKLIPEEADTHAFDDKAYMSSVLTPEGRRVGMYISKNLEITPLQSKGLK